MAETRAQQQIPIDMLVLPNFLHDHCHLSGAPYKVLDLDESFINEIGSEVAPKSCKGQVCWSWQASSKRNFIMFSWQIYDSTLPLRISNIEKLSKTISQTIKQTESLRKSSSSLVDAAQEYIKSSFSTGKEKGITKERTITEQKSREQSIETNITPAFHKYLGMAIQGPFVATYPFCISSATDLFFKAYDNDKVNDLVEAFVVYKTVNPEDIAFSGSKTMMNRAKFLYSIFRPTSSDFSDGKKFMWAQATLFSKLLEWPEFSSVKTIVDSYIDQTFNTYTLMKTKTTRDLAGQNKLLAAIKLANDKYLTQNNLHPATDIVEDSYTDAAIFYYYQRKNQKEVENLNQMINEALQNNDQILNVKLIKQKPISNSIFLVFLVLVVGIVIVVDTIIRKRKKKNQQININEPG